MREAVEPTFSESNAEPALLALGAVTVASQPRHYRIASVSARLIGTFGRYWFRSRVV
jgi:hypothetical protein